MGDFFKRYLWAIDVVAVLLSAYFAAKITSVYIAKRLEVPPGKIEVLAKETVEPVDEKRVAVSDYKIIIDRNLFDSSEAPLPTEEMAEEKKENSIPTGEAVKTTLGIKVYGVLVVGVGKDSRSSATVQGQGGANSAVETYAVGEENGFAPNTKLIQVRPDRIEFVHSGRLEYAILEEEGGGSIFGSPIADLTGVEPTPSAPPKSAGEGSDHLIKALGGNKFVIDQGEIDSALTNLDTLYTKIRIVPNISGGQVAGMKILNISRGSIFEKLGLKRGDVLDKINGMELDVKQGFQIFSQLKEEKSFTLDLIRQGQKQTFEYEVR